MKYLLDTNICIYLLNGNNRLTQKVSQIGILSLSISTSVLAELYFGAYNSTRVTENLQRIEIFKKRLTILSDSEQSAKIFGEIKADLRSKGEMIEDFDILIASIALTNHCVIVTNNVSHFERVHGLDVENWLDTDSCDRSSRA